MLRDISVNEFSTLRWNFQEDVVSVNWAGGFTGSDGRSFVDSVEDAKEAIQFAGLVDADCLVLHSGGMNGHTDRHAYRIFEHAIDSLLPVAEDYGVRLAIEPMCEVDSHPWSIFSQIKSSLDLVKAYESTNLGLVIDLFHCGFRHRRLPGFGNVDLSYWLESLGTAGANCSVEFETYGVVNQPIDYLQRLAAFNRFASLRHLSPPRRTDSPIATDSKIYKN